MGGRPVERLRLADECVNTKSCPHTELVDGGAGRPTDLSFRRMAMKWLGHRMYPWYSDAVFS